jgi:hypothetical protein
MFLTDSKVINYCFSIDVIIIGWRLALFTWRLNNQNEGSHIEKMIIAWEQWVLCKEKKEKKNKWKEKIAHTVAIITLLTVTESLRRR